MKIRKAKKHIGKMLDQMYKTFVRPHLDYYEVIYHIPPKQNQLGVVLNSVMEMTEKVQDQAALDVTGTW